MEGLKVAIIGHEDNWDDGLDKQDEGFELWGFDNTSLDFGPAEATRWFQLQSAEYLNEYWQPVWNIHKEEWRQHWASGGITPLYLHQRDAILSGSVDFPKKDIEKAFPKGWYHCSSFDWLVSFALLEGAKEIHIYGCALSWNGEPLSARACLEYWLGYAEGRGVKVYTNAWDLFHTFQLLRSRRQYAWDDVRSILDL